MAYFSIVIPSFNKEGFIETPINSLKNQSFFDFEAIIIDDASTDSTVFVIESLIEGDERFKIFSLEENKGPGNARNEGIKKAEGEVILFLDADDAYEREALQKIFERYQEFSCDVVYFNGIVINSLDSNQGSFYPSYGESYFSKSYNLKNSPQNYNAINITNNTLVSVKREFLRENHIFFKDFPSFQDWDFCWHLASKSPSFYFIQEPLYFYHFMRNQKSITSNSFYLNKNSRNLLITDVFTSALNYFSNSPDKEDLMEIFYHRAFEIINNSFLLFIGMRNFDFKNKDNKEWLEKYLEKFHSKFYPLSLNFKRNLFGRESFFLLLFVQPWSQEFFEDWFVQFEAKEKIRGELEKERSIVHNFFKDITRISITPEELREQIKQELRKEENFIKKKFRRVKRIFSFL